MDAPRFKTNAKGREIRLCSGKGNTCTKDAKVDDTCTGCKTGRDNTIFRDRTEGEIFADEHGTRYILVGGQIRQLCIGDDNKCMSVRKDSTNLCTGHKVGNKRYRIGNVEKGHIETIDGIPYIYDGKQRRKKCPTDGCTAIAIRGGPCKKHIVAQL